MIRKLDCWLNYDWNVLSFRRSWNFSLDRTIVKTTYCHSIKYTTIKIVNGLNVNPKLDKSKSSTWSKIFHYCVDSWVSLSREALSRFSVTSKMLPNCWKICPIMISLEKWWIFSPLQKLPTTVGNLGKLWKVAQSAINRPIRSHCRGSNFGIKTS